MKKAYCVFDGFNKNAIKVIKEPGIDLTINQSKNTKW